ncbi:MAG: hypothetical protein PW791_09245 [Neorhizobium sp.]|nr:hypothetical protein [Neorhizobium sp.]
MATNDFLPFATATGANVLDQTSYNGLAARSSGFQAGVASSANANKVWRQASTIAALIGQFIVENSGEDAEDNGDIATLLANFTAALAGSVGAENFLEKAGGTMTGPLILDEIATNALEAVPLEQVQVLSRRFVGSTTSVTVPPGATRAIVKLWGAGGGGGGTVNSGSIGQGGGGGEYREGTVSVVAGQAMSAVLGAGGGGGNAGAANNGTAGGNSSFGGITANGGGGGVGSSSGSGSTVTNGGSGGTGGAFILSGMSGETGFVNGTTSILLLGGGASFGCGHNKFSASNYATAVGGNPGSFPGQGGSAGGSGGAGGGGAGGFLIIDWLP